MGKKILRKPVAVLLCAVMLMTCIPVTAFAEGSSGTAETQTETAGEIPMTEENAASPSEITTEATPSEAVITATPSEPIVLSAVATDGMKITIIADEDAFETSEGLELVAEAVTPEEAEDAAEEIDTAEGDSNVAKRATYDIRVEKDGVELQPLEGKSVKVEFSFSGAPSGADDVTVYHHDEEDGLTVIATEELTEDTESVSTDAGAAAALPASSEDGSDEADEEELAGIDDEELINDLVIEGETDSFSLYTVDFTYDDKTVSIAGDTVKNPLSDVLAGAGITDAITDVEVYSDDVFTDRCEDGTVRNGDEILFKIYSEDGVWYVDAVNPFSTAHGIIVKTADAEYRVKVTDAGTAAGGSYLTFTAETAGATVRFSWKSADTDVYPTGVQISRDGGNTWSNYNKNTQITLAGVGDKVSFRGNDVITNDENHFTMSGKIASSGDVTSLTNGTGGDATLSYSCYRGMFIDCSSLTSAPELPATTLSNACYMDMFRGCSSLTSAPKLESATLADSCYKGMFYGCSSLTNAPDLPAITLALAYSCYDEMFYGCSSLTEAPELPATTLAICCYLNMFRGCSSLTSAPELPATMLADYCYAGMFAGCSSLTRAPELPATTLAGYCYEIMFSGCSSLTEAPELPATTLAICCYSNMFIGCKLLKVYENNTTGNLFPWVTTEIERRACFTDMLNGTIKGEDGSTRTSTLYDHTYYLKKYTQPAPTGLTSVPCSGTGTADGKITGVDDTMEYFVDDGANWTSVTGTEITGLSEGSVQVRYKETATKQPGEIATITVTARETQPAPTGLTSVPCSAEGISDGKITGVDNTMEYSTDGGENWTSVTGTEITGLSEGTVQVRYKGTVAKQPGVIATITVTARETQPAPAGLTSVPCSGTGTADGKIQGVDDTMEYSKDGGANWTSVTGTEITGLSEGTVLVRYKETATKQPGEIAVITVTVAAPEQPEYEDIQNADGEAWTSAPEVLGSEAAPIGSGTWKYEDGIWKYYMGGSPLRNTFAWISYVGSDKKTYVGCFYFDRNGRMQTGWQQTGSNWYYFNPSAGSDCGIMLRNTSTPDGYKVGPDGKWIS